jgi:hypothetical protein
VAVLNTEDRAFWDENGYVIIPDAVPPENIKAAKASVWDFLEMRSDERESWYPNPPRRGIMAEMYQHQALWDNRQYPRVHQAFAEILGCEQLWVSIDRVSLSPPERTPSKDSEKLPSDSISKPPIPMHWDYALQLHGDGKPTLTQGCFDTPIPFWVQGVLYLTDTAADGGAFACVPEFHRNIEGWLETLPADIDPRVQDKDGRLFQGYDAWLETLPSNADSLKQDLIGYGAKPVPAKAGDLIIWHNSLPHGAGYNTSEHPRVVQYMTMLPAQEKDETALKLRLKAWRNSMEDWLVEAPSVKEELRKEKERDRGETAKLSPLGRKLLGVDSWE